MPDQMHGPRCSCPRCYTHYQLSQRAPINDTHLCSGGPEEITDEEWTAWHSDALADSVRSFGARDGALDPFESAAPGFTEEP